MLQTLGLLLMAACFVSESSARLTVTLLDRDYSYVKPNDVLANHMQRVIDRMNSLKVTLHPRIRHLYELLKKDVAIHYEKPGEKHGQRHHAPQILDFNKTLKPTYDVNKLNRIYTTEADG